MAGQKLTLVIDTEGGSQTLKDLKQIQSAIEEALGAAESGGDKFDFGKALSGLTEIANSYNEITSAVQGFLGQLQPAYELLIGSNERLNQQLLESAATITATSQVMANGMEITDPTQAITALQPALKSAIKDVELATQSLVGVTSAQTSTVFNTILGNAGLLNDQLKGAGEGGKDLNNSIEAAASLAPGLVATLGVLQLPIGQASDEIGNLLRGEIDSTAQVAKSLGIKKEMIEKWKSEGILVSELNKRFQPFLAANKLASRSVAGLTSNIQDIVEVTGRTAGAPLLDILVDQLEVVYNLLQANQGEITEVATSVVQRIADALQQAIGVINNIATLLAPGLAAIKEALLESFDASATTAESTITNLGAAIATLIKVATPFIQLAGSLVAQFAQLAATPAGQTLIQTALGLAAVNAVSGKVLSFATAYTQATNSLFGVTGKLIPLLKESGIVKAALAAKELALAVVTGTTSAGMKAQAIFAAASAAGNTKLALSTLQVAAAEQVRAKAMVQSAVKGGLLVAAIASIALVAQTYQELTASTREVEKSFEGVSRKLNELNALSLETAKSPEEAAKNAQEIAARNEENLRNNLSVIQKILDFVRNGFNQAQAFVKNLFKTILTSIANLPGIDQLFPNLDKQLAGLIDAIPPLATAADTAIINSNAAVQIALGKSAEAVAELKLNLAELGRGGDIKALQTQLTTLQGELIKKNEELATAGLSPERKAQLEAETQAITAQITATQNNINAQVKGAETGLAVYDDNIKILEEQRDKTTDPAIIQSLTDRITLLKQERDILAASAGDIGVNSKALENQGTIYQQLNKKATSALDSLKNAGDQDALNTAAQTVTELTQQQVELGQITAEEGQKRLQAIVDDGRIELDARTSAQEAITKLQQQAGENRLQTLQRQQSQVEAKIAQGQLTEVQGQKQLTSLKAQELEQQLKDKQAAIAAEEADIAAGSGSQQRLEQLKTEAAALGSQAAEARATATQAGIDAELEIYKTRQSEIEQLQAEGTIDDEEAQRRITANRVNELQKRLSLVQANIAKEQAAGRDPKALIQEAQQIATELAQARSASAKADLDARLADIEEAGKKVIDATRLAETQRNIELQKQLNEGLITEEEYNKQKLAGQQETTKAELAAEQDRLAALRATPPPVDPDEREALEQQIRDSVQKTADLQLTLLEQERQAQQALRDEARKRIDQEIQKIQLRIQKSQIASDRITRGLNAEIHAYDGILQSLDQESNLLGARGQLVQAQAQYEQTLADLRVDGLNEAKDLTTQLDEAQEQGNSKAVNLIRKRLQELGVNPYASQEQVLKQIVDAEKERADLAEANQNRQQAIARQQLEIDIQREQIAGRRAVLEARIAATQAQQALNEAKGKTREAEKELEKAQLIEDPQERAAAIQEAQLGVASARESEANAAQSLGFALEGVGLAEDNLEQLDQTAQLRRDSLSLEQQTADATLEASNNAAVFRAELEAANSASAGIADNLSGASAGVGIPARRTGGDIQPNQLYQVHKDELFVANRGGYMLNRSDAMRVARNALAQGVPPPQIANLGSMAPAGDARLLQAIDSLSRNLSQLEGGINIGMLQQSITNQLPKDMRAVQAEIERSQLDLLRSIRNGIRKYP